MLYLLIYSLTMTVFTCIQFHAVIVRFYDRSFQYASRCRLVSGIHVLPTSPRQPRVSLCITDSPLLTQALSNKSLSSDDSSLSPSATPSLSLPAQNSPSHKTFPPKTLSLSIDWLHGLRSLSVILSILVFCIFSFRYIFIVWSMR